MTAITNSRLLRSEPSSNQSYDHRILTFAGLLFIAAIIAIVGMSDFSGVSANDLATMTVYP